MPGYKGVVEHCFGRLGGSCMDAVVCVQALGTTTGYLCIVGDVASSLLRRYLPTVFHRDYVYVEHVGAVQLRSAALLLVSAAVVFPLCLIPRMDSLRFVSLVSLAMIVAYALSVLFSGFFVVARPERRETWYETMIDPHSEVCGKLQVKKGATLNPPGDHVAWLPKNARMLSALPIMSFSFLCHQNAFPIYKELRDASAAKMTRISKWST